MNRTQPYSDEDIAIIYREICSQLLVKDLTSLDLDQLKSLLSHQEEFSNEDIINLKNRAESFNTDWEKLINPQHSSTELLLVCGYPNNKEIKPVKFGISESRNDRRIILRVPIYLVNADFKKYGTEVFFGSLPIEKLEAIKSVYGDFKPYKDGALSYIQIDEMCIYLHQFIMVKDNNVRYCHKYIFESFSRFVAHDMMIYKRQDNYDFIKEVDEFLTNRYTNEMFDKLFTNLTDDELTVLKMRVI
jgi:hypothetical protein